MKQFLIINFSFFILFLLTSLLSCEVPEIQSTINYSGNENILRFDVAAPFISLNPAELEQSGSAIIFPLLYSYLFVPDIKGELEPDLATSWTYDPDTFTWTIQIRKDAFFHDHRPVNSDDVSYSIRQILRNIYPTLYSTINEISVSPENIIITLKTNDPQFLNKIWNIEIMPDPDRMNGSDKQHTIGSGPFKLQSRKGKEKIVLAANTLYYNGRPSLDSVVFSYQPDKEKAWTRLLSGQTDIAREISPKNYEIIKQYEDEFYFDNYTLAFYSLLLYNCGDILFTDARVRQAMTHAINRKYIVKSILKGYAEIAEGPMGVNSPYRNPDVKPLPYAPQTSIKLLQQAGWEYEKDDKYLYKDGNPFEFTLQAIKESQIEKQVAQYIKLCLNEIGIKMHIQLLPYEKFLEDFLYENSFQAILTEFTGAYIRPEYLIEQWHLPPAFNSGTVYFEHSEISQLLHQAVREKDSMKQKQILYEADALLTSLQPGTFLFHKNALDVMSKRFTLKFPFSLSNEGIYRLQFASLVRN